MITYGGASFDREMNPLLNGLFIGLNPSLLRISVYHLKPDEGCFKYRFHPRQILV